jgi:hypothetical protein
MAGERQFEGAAHAGAVDRRDPRLAARLQLAEQAGHRAGVVEQRLDRLFWVLVFFGGVGGQHFLQHGDIGAAGETVLARGDHRALDRGIRRHLVDDAVQLMHHRLGEDIHRALRHVPGDQRNARC